MEATTTSNPPLSSGLSTGGLTTFLTSQISPESSLYPHLNKLTPKTNNIAAALVTILYVKIVMEVGMLIRIKFDLPEISRKFIHICACSYVVFWPLFDVEHWGWRLNATVPVVMSFRLFYKGAILKDPEDHDVRSMSRSSSPYELLYGPLQLTIIMSYTGLTKFMTKSGIIIMGAFVGDWLAALIGVHYGKHKFTVPLGGQKSIEGSFGCVLGTMAGISFYSYMVGMEIEEWKTLLAYGVISAVVEGTAWREWDNAFLAAAMEFSAKRLPGLMS